MANENQENSFFAVFNRIFLAVAGIIFIVMVILSLYFVLSTAFKSKPAERPVNQVTTEAPADAGASVQTTASDAVTSAKTQSYQYLLYSKTDMKTKRDSGLTSFTVKTLKGVKGFTQRGVPVINGINNKKLADIIVSTNGEYNGVQAVAVLLFMNDGTNDAAGSLTGIYIWQAPEGDPECNQWINNVK